MKRKYYRTSDFGLATILSYLFDLEGMEMKDAKSVMFLFKESKELNDTVNQYWNRQLRVEPLQLQEAQKTLKARMYNFLNQS